MPQDFSNGSVYLSLIFLVSSGTELSGMLDTSQNISSESSFERETYQEGTTLNFYQTTFRYCDAFSANCPRFLVSNVLGCLKRQYLHSGEI